MVNIQGLSGKFINKLKLLEVRDIFANNDIVLFTETRGSDQTKFTVNDFTYFELNRTKIKPNCKQASGGIIIYMRTSLVEHAVNISNSVKRFGDDIMWLSLTNMHYYVSILAPVSML